MSSSTGTAFAREIRESEHWLTPNDLLAQLDIRPGATVGEIGAGKALYTLPIARRVGISGSVLAIEWRPWLLDGLRGRLAASDVPENVRLVVGRPAETHLAAESCDLLLFADIWHELEHPDAVLDEARRVLRPDGRLVIVNWSPEAAFPPGPPIEHRASMRKTLCTVEMKAWSLVRDAEIGSNGYLLAFEITDESVQS